MRAADADVADAASVVRARRWVGEAVVLVGVYTLYSLVRNVLGSAIVPFSTAAAHARDVLHLERLVGIDVELGVHRLALHAESVVRGAGFYYRTVHPWAVIATLAWLLARRPSLYPRFRTALLVTTVLALVGFALYPLAPPRLLPQLGFVDTVRLPHSLWHAPPDPSRFHFAAMVTNQFAAMPSLHLAWPTWVIAATFVGRAPRWARALAVTHLVVTSFAVVATANHWVLDGVAGAALAGVGFFVAARVPMRLQVPIRSLP